MMIDSHAHIYLSDFDDDLNDVLHKAKNEGVVEIYMPNIDSSTIGRMHQVEERFSYCKSMMGLHPCYVKENYIEELAIVRENVEKRKYAAIGEIGIDLYWDKTFADEQIESFAYQIELAKDHDLGIVIHSRDSLEKTIEMVSSFQDGNLKGIFHCFNGTEAQGRQIIDLGFFLGIGGVVTYKNAGVDKVVSKMPLSSLVLETDSPYLSPGPKRTKRNDPSRLSLVLDKLEMILQEDRKEISAVTSINCRKVFLY